MGELASLLRASGDEPELFTRFYRLTAEGLLRFTARRVPDPELALDLVAESFARAFLKRKSFRGSTDAEAQAWLYIIGRNELASYYRKARVEQRAIKRLGVQAPVAGIDDLERIEQLADLAGRREVLRGLVGSLPEAQAVALRLRIIEELPYPEVAQRLGISEPGARTRVARGLRAVADALTDEEAEQLRGAN